jgi:hypothetical protein
MPKRIVYTTAISSSTFKTWRNYYLMSAAKGAVLVAALLV